MRASRAEFARRAVLSCGLALASFLLLPAPAPAQVGQPVPLLPPTLPAAPDTAAPPPPAAPAPPASADSDITAQPLAPVDGSWIGTLTEAQGGLPHDMWHGSSRALIAALLPQLQPSDSPELHSLAHRLLLSDADAPAGSDAPDHPALAALRLDRLLALGEVTGASPLLTELPAAAASEDFDRAQIELRFAANDAKGACVTVQARMVRYQDPWWDRALIACQALAGDAEKAALGLSVLADQKATRDPVFNALVESVLGHPQRIDKLPDPSPLRLALLAAAKQPLPAAALAAAGPAALYGYATNDAVPVERRLPAAERAALLGALPPAALGKLYAAVTFKPEEQNAAFTAGKPFAVPKSRAILYDVARSSTDEETRAAAIAALLADGHRRGAFAATAALVAPLLAEVPASNEINGFAADAARALIVTGHADAAAPWLAEAKAKELDLLAALAAPNADGADLTPLLREAIAALASRDSAPAQAQAGLLLTLVCAFTPVGALDWQPLLAPPHQAVLPSPVLWLAQIDESGAKRSGGTVLTTLLIAQSNGHLTTEPILLSRALAALVALGFDKDARALAVEAAVEAGI